MPKHIPDRVSFQVRINETLHAKVKQIAKLENRNLNSQCEYFLAKCVARWEQENGELATCNPEQ